MSLQAENDLDFEIEQIKEMQAERNVSFGDALTMWNAGIRPGGLHAPWVKQAAAGVRIAA